MSIESNELNWFFRCTCDKLHTHGGITSGSVCTCGQDLYTFVWHTHGLVLDRRNVQA